MAWNSEVVPASQTNAVGEVKNRIDARGNITQASAAGPNDFTASVVGMNVNKIPSMKAAIRTYVNKIKTQVNRLHTDVKTDKAFKSSDGSVEDAVSRYLQSVETYCNNLTSALLAFNDKLTDVEKAWETSMEHLSSTIEDDKNKVENAADLYTEKNDSNAVARAKQDRIMASANQEIY